MIEIQRSSVVGAAGVKVVGLGGAGSNAVDDLLRRGGVDFGCVVANTDSRALQSSVAETRCILGQSLTRGLGCGGDPELGRAAVEESLEGLLKELEGNGLLIVVVGLGGGTGSGGAPRLVEAAKGLGMRVVVLATLPFSFEGRRRMDQASESLGQLRAWADLVVCFENDRMSALADGEAGIGEAFAVVDGVLGQAVRALARVHERRGLMNTGLDEVGSVLSGSQARAAFGFGRAEGEERMTRALRQALESPLMAGCVWEQVSGVWVSCGAGESVRWREVQLAMEDLQGWLPAWVRLFVGVSIDPALGEAVEVSLMAGGQASGVIEGGRREARNAVQTAVGGVKRESGPLPQEEPSLAAGEPSASVESPVSLPQEEPVEPFVSASEEDAEVVQQRNEGTAAESASFEEDQVEGLGATREEEVPAVDTEELRRDVGAALLKRRIAERLLAKAGRRGDEAVGDEDVAERSGEMAGGMEVEEIRDAQPSVQASVSEAARWPEEYPNRAEQPVRQESRVGAPEASEVGGVSVAARPESGSSKARGPVQEQMHFETASRGRFEKTDPTMVDGQDLDVPTFMRQGLMVNREEEGNSR
jgi:cell division protein FtsZ